MKVEYNNIFINYGTGIMLNGPNGASIDADQGGIGNAWDNVWNPGGSSNLKIAGLLLGIPTGLNWFHQAADNPGNNWSPNPWNGNIINPKENEASGNVTCDDFSRYAVNRVANFGSIVGDSANYSTDSLATRYQSRLEAYRSMKNDTTIIYQFDSLDTAFINFFTTLDTGNVGRFYRIVEIAAIDSDSAAYLNAQINPVGETETLLKSYYELYFGKIITGDTLSPADSSDLEFLTQLSRSAYGDMVHNTAAALFHEIHPYETPLRFGTSNTQYPYTSGGINTVDEVRIYPNPAREAITLVASTEMKSVEIFNSYGSLLIKRNCKGKTEYIESNMFPSGIYHAKTTLQSGDMVVTKFVLQK